MDKEYNYSNLYHINNKIRNKLLELLSKFIDIKDNRVIDLFKNKKSDKEILIELVKYANKNIKGYKNEELYNNEEFLRRKADKRAYYMKNFIDNSSAKDIKVNNYLDIGCNTGYNTVALGRKYGLHEKNIHGIDIGKFGNIVIKPIKGFIYNDYDGVNIPFGDNSFDLITMLMVFHHVKEQDKIISEIKRVLRPNGILYLREHNRKKGLKYLFRLEHYLYGIFVDKTVTVNNLFLDYDHYVSKRGLIKLLSRYGFVRVKLNDRIKYIEKVNYFRNNPTNYYNIAFELKKN